MTTVTLPPRNQRMVVLNCACCGNLIRGIQVAERDTGWGICKSCGPLYGYNTEGPVVTVYKQETA